MKRYLILFIIVSVALSSCSKKQLSEQQKADDFLYLYETLEANFPYFYISKNKTGIDWLANKDIYLEKVRSTPNDSAYARALEEIISDLENGHVDLSPTTMYDTYASIFKDVIKEYPKYTAWAEIFENAKPRIYYWADILNDEPSGQDGGNTEPRISGYKDTILTDKRIAIMKVPSVEVDFIEIDAPDINKLMGNLKDVDQLVIDIQGNGGGSDFYWRDLIVSRLTQDTIFYTKYYALKDGSINRKFYADIFENLKRVTSDDPFYEKIHPEFKNNRFQIFAENDTIAPKDPIDFKGKIYVLVDGSVFSSAEGLAYFAKATGWAEVVGKRTHGDGIGSDPVVVSLPESGMLFRFPVTAGFNTDGSVNTEVGTMPTHIIEGETRKERQENLIKNITP